LAPCDFFLFPNLKKSFAAQKFASNEEVVAATESYFAYLDKTYFSDGLKKLEHRWVKCIELKVSKIFVFLLEAKYFSDHPRTYECMYVIFWI